MIRGSRCQSTPSVHVDFDAVCVRERLCPLSKACLVAVAAFGLFAGRSCWRCSSVEVGLARRRRGPAPSSCRVIKEVRPVRLRLRRKLVTILIRRRRTSVTSACLLCPSPLAPVASRLFVAVGCRCRAGTPPPLSRRRRMGSMSRALGGAFSASRLPIMSPVVIYVVLASLGALVARIVPVAKAFRSSRCRRRGSCSVV